MQNLEKDKHETLNKTDMGLEAKEKQASTVEWSHPPWDHVNREILSENQ